LYSTGLTCPKCGRKATAKEIRYVVKKGKLYGPYLYYGHGRGVYHGRFDNYPVEWCYIGKVTIQPRDRLKELKGQLMAKKSLKRAGDGPEPGETLTVRYLMEALFGGGEG